jgi:RNA polymerase sigma-70 factor (ECF subfamily)
MNESLADRLSQIATQWSVLEQAHADEEKTARWAQEQLLQRYGGAIRRYLLACVRQADVADELYQEFAMRLLQGGLKGARPDKGKFRHYLKGVLFHLLADHHQRTKRQPAAWASHLPEPAGDEQIIGQAQDDQFTADWRAELLAHAWEQLQRDDEQTGQPFFKILAYRRDHPEERSDMMAENLSQVLGKSVTAENVRQLLHRARERFADVLLDQVMHSLSHPSLPALQEELADLQLLQYCQPALARYDRTQA